MAILVIMFPKKKKLLKGFDWALEFTECAVNKFYKEQGVEELKPYCNFFDVTYSKYLHMGIDAHYSNLHSWL